MEVGVIIERGRWGWMDQSIPGQVTAQQGLGGRAWGCVRGLGTTLPSRGVGKEGPDEALKPRKPELARWGLTY